MSALPVELKPVVEEIKNEFENFKKRNDEALEEVRKFGEASGYTKQTLDEHNDVITDLRKRQEELEARMQRPGYGGNANSDEELDKRWGKAFDRFLRTGNKDQYINFLSEIPAEKRGLSSMVDTEGGVFVQPQFATEMLHKAHNFPGIRQNASVMTIGTDALVQPVMGTATVAWTPETAATSQQNIANSAVQIGTNEMTALVKVTKRLLEDSAFNIQSALSSEFAATFAEEEDQQFAIGASPLKPSGIFVETGVLANVVNSGVAANIYDGSNNGVDALIDLQQKPKAKYRVNGKYGYSSATEGAIRKLKDSQGRYLWEPGVQPGMPPTLLGKGTFVTEYAPAIAANAYPVIFGDWRYYQIIDRVGLSVQVLTELYSVNSQVGFLARKRVGGATVLTEAFAALRCHT